MNERCSESLDSSCWKINSAYIQNQVLWKLCLSLTSEADGINMFTSVKGSKTICAQNWTSSFGYKLKDYKGLRIVMIYSVGTKPN